MVCSPAVEVQEGEVSYHSSENGEWLNRMEPLSCALSLHALYCRQVTRALSAMCFPHSRPMLGFTALSPQPQTSVLKPLWKHSTLWLMSFDVSTPQLQSRDTIADPAPPRSYLLGRYRQDRVFSASLLLIHKDLVCGSRSPSGLLATMQILHVTVNLTLTEVKHLAEVECLPYSYFCVI